MKRSIVWPYEKAAQRLHAISSKIREHESVLDSLQVNSEHDLIARDQLAYNLGIVRAFLNHVRCEIEAVIEKEREEEATEEGEKDDEKVMGKLIDEVCREAHKTEKSEEE